MDQFYPDEALKGNLLRLVAGGVHFRFTSLATPFSMATTLAALNTNPGAGTFTVAAAAFFPPSVAGNKGSIVAGDITMTNISGAGIAATGYFVTDAATDLILLAVAAFDAPIELSVDESINVTPKFTNSSLFAS